MPGPSPVGRRLPEEKGRTPVSIILLLILVIMVPIEFSFSLGSVFFTASRAYLVALTFIILPYLGTLKLRLFDWLFIAHVGWTCMAYLLIFPSGKAVEMAGSYALEFLTVYLAARIFLQTVEHMRAMIRLLFILVVISGVAALPEAFTGVRYVHDLATTITGNTYRFGSEMRMGITRATSFFEHPILYGVFCGSVFGLMWFTNSPAQRLWKAPVIAFATWLSASSAPLLVLLVQVVMLLVEYFTRRIRRRDKIFAWIAGLFVLGVETFTGRGVVGVVTLMTLNPSTAYTRRSQWNFAMDDVMRSPWIGFNAGRWTRPHWLAGSIDNWWLLMMMRSGIPSLILLALSALFLWIAIARRTGGPPLFGQLRTGWGLMMVGVILGAATVTFFGKLQPLFAFYMGLGAALATCVLPKGDGSAVPASTGPVGIAYTRFPRTTAPAAIIPDSVRAETSSPPRSVNQRLSRT